MRGAKPETALDALARSAVTFARGECVLVACSGGADSVALAAILDRIAHVDGFELVLAHVNHGVRDSAWQDECVVLAVGARLGRAVRVVGLAPAGDAEATLRDARYAALASLARGCGATTVATAHTAEDQTETVLLALFRGTGPDGIAGMAPERELEPGIRLVRPLLRVTHDELAAERFRSGLPVAIDPTNAESRYRRNVLRVALTGLRAEFPQLDRAVARYAEIVRQEVGGDERAQARRNLRTSLRAKGDLRDIPFERIEAALSARPEGRVFLKPGLERDAGDLL